MDLRLSAVPVTLLAAAFLCISVNAQTDDWDRLNSIRTGSSVIVGLRNGQNLRGKLRGVSADRLDLSTGGKVVAIPKADVKSVHRAKRGSMIGRALIGAAAGAGIGLGGGAILVAASKDPLAGVAGILIGVPAGAVIGAATTGKGKRGELLYFAP